MSNQGEGASSNKTMTGARVAILGYGPEAREQAMRLRAAGNDVRVGVRPGGMSWVRATEDGFAPQPTGTAVSGADVVAVMVPEEDQPALFWRAIAPNLAKGALVVFARGTAVHTGAVDPGREVDVALVTAHPSLDRVGCRVAVHNDATGNALARAAAFARVAMGESAQKVGTTTFADEVEADLASFEERVGGPGALLAELDEVLARSGTHEPDEAKTAYFERLRALVARRASSKLPTAPASSTHVRTMPWTKMRGVA